MIANITSSLLKSVNDYIKVHNTACDYIQRDMLCEVRNILEKCHEPKDLKVDDIIRMPNYDTADGFRLWKIISIDVGAMNQEPTYELKVLDKIENLVTRVPCIMLELHPLVQRI